MLNLYTLAPHPVHSQVNDTPQTCILHLT
uniref:Uncharacterized protein n=1 Tax=Anguilla anguilla TaxID=7936 RepID=A0A0E9RCX6_ANGAN